MRVFKFIERTLSLYGLVWLLPSLGLILADSNFTMKKGEMLIAIAVCCGYATVRDVIDKRVEDDKVSDD